MKKATIIIVIVIAVGVTLYLLLTRHVHKPPVWKTAKVERGNIIMTVTATGTLSPDTTVQVGAQVSGIVSHIYVDFDSAVKKKQVIAKLDTTLLYSSLVVSQAAADNALAQYNLQRLIFSRTDTLFRQKVASKSDYDQSYANLKVSEANYKSALANYRHEKINLGYATIYAPVDGIVISRNVDVGQTVISSFNAPNLFSIAIDLHRMQNLANVDEADIGQVHPGQEAAFTVDAFPYDVFKGTVSQIRLQPVMIQNVNNYIVVINFANPELKLLPGLTATTTIKTNEHDDVKKVLINTIHFAPPTDYLKTLQLPKSFQDTIERYKISGNIIPKPGTKCIVWMKQQNGGIKPAFVITGIFDGTNIEIEGDIKAGDELIAGGVSGGPAVSGAPTANNPFMPQMRPATTKR